MRLRLPEGLRARLILLLLGALAAAQVLTLMLFLDERGLAVRAAAGEEAGARTLALAQALDAAPPAARATLAAQAGSRALRFALGPAPATQRAGARALPDLARQIGGDGRRVLAALVAATPHSDDRDDDAPHRERADRLVIAMALADGTWLNAETRLRRPALQLGAPVLASTLIAALAVVAVVWVTVGRIAQPMSALATAADALGRGERPAPLPLSGPREVRQVTGAFNAMAERLTRLLDERARTLAAIGHDLRSPITAMRLRIEMVDDAETRERLGANVDEMQTLVEGALALARGGGTEEPAQAVDLAALLAGLAAEMAEAGAAVTVAAATPAVLRGRPGALRRALRNIAENAVRYGGAAHIALRREAGALVVEIADDGPGIPPADRARVFEPFVRLETSRSRETGGAGLGLAIARAVIEGHGGTVAIGDAPGGGALLRVVLPA